MSEIPSEYLATVRRALLGAAFRNGALIDAPPDDPRIAKLIAEKDWVFAAWPDHDEPGDGFRLISVRGCNMLHEGGDAHADVIPRRDRESALALQAMYATPADFQSNNDIDVRPRPKLRVISADSGEGV